MTRQRRSVFLLTLTLSATAGLQAACAESDGNRDQPAAPAEREQDEQAPTANDAAPGGSGDKPYRVSCSNDGCVAGTDVVVGYDIYGKYCHRCHGGHALGSSFAPTLVGRLEDMSKAEFIAVVADGKTVFDSTTGGYRVMPGWKGSEDVMGHVNQLWAYLKARSDKALKAVRPTPME